MNVLQIEKVLKKDVSTHRIFIGVYPSDRIPKRITRFPSAFVVNTDPHYKSGTHWMAFYVNSPNSAEFFDSYGHSPNFFNRYISNYFKNYSHVTYNDVSLQSDSTAVCGQYCIYYLYFRCRNRSMKFIIDSLQLNSMQNDKRVYNFVKKKLYNEYVPFYIS
nr:TPA_asm: adenain [Parasteatoda house spider adintovirus]